MKPDARVVLATAVAAQAAISLVNFGLPSIGPELRQQFHLGLSTLGAVESAPLLGSGLCLIPAGIAVDRYGAKGLSLLGIGLGTIGLVVAAFSSSVAVLAAMLFLTGVGAAIIPIAGIGALFRAFPVERRAWALGMRQMGVPLGGVVGAVMLPPLAHAGGARAVLLTIAGLSGAAGLVFALVGAGGQERAAVRPRPQPVRILRIPGMRRLLLVAACLIVVLQSTLVFAVPAARDAGLSRFTAGAVFFTIQITAGVARVLWGRIADAHGGSRRVRTLVEAAWLASAGALLFGLSLHAGAGAVFPAAVVFAFGALGWNALVYVRAGEMAPPELAAQGVAIAATVVFFLSGACAAPMGALADHAGWDTFWAVLAVLAAAGGLVALTLRPAGHAGRSAVLYLRFRRATREGRRD